MNPEQLQRHKTNVSTKVSREEKERIDQLAEELGIKRSEYLRNLIFDRNGKISAFMQLPSKVIVHPEQATETASIIENLQKTYPGKSGSEIILGALKVAEEHEKRSITYSLKKAFK